MLLRVLIAVFAASIAVSSCSPPPRPASAPTVSLTADSTSLLAGDSTTLRWTSTNATSVVDSSFGAQQVSGSLVVTPPATTTYTITVSGPGGQASATVAVVIPVAVSITPQTATAWVTKQVQFTATVTGTTNTGVTWRVAETGGGTVTSEGLYTAPATRGTYHVEVVSAASPDAKATASITVDSVDLGIVVH